MTAIRLPRVASFRQLAKEIVANSTIEEGSNIEVDGGDVVASTPSFIDELLRDIASRKPATITIVDADPELLKDAQSVANHMNVKLHTRTSTLS